MTVVLIIPAVRRIPRTEFTQLVLITTAGKCNTVINVYSSCRKLQKSCEEFFSNDGWSLASVRWIPRTVYSAANIDNYSRKVEHCDQSLQRLSIITSGELNNAKNVSATRVDHQQLHVVLIIPAVRRIPQTGLQQLVSITTAGKLNTTKTVSATIVDHPSSETNTAKEGLQQPAITTTGKLNYAKKDSTTRVEQFTAKMNTANWVYMNSYWLLQL